MSPHIYVVIVEQSFVFWDLLEIFLVEGNFLLAWDCTIYIGSV